MIPDSSIYGKIVDNYINNPEVKVLVAHGATASEQDDKKATDVAKRILRTGTDEQRKEIFGNVSKNVLSKWIFTNFTRIYLFFSKDNSAKFINGVRQQYLTEVQNINNILYGIEKGTGKKMKVADAKGKLKFEWSDNKINVLVNGKTFSMNTNKTSEFDSNIKNIINELFEVEKVENGMVEHIVQRSKLGLNKEQVNKNLTITYDAKEGEYTLKTEGMTETSIKESEIGSSEYFEKINTIKEQIEKREQLIEKQSEDIL